MADLKVEIHHLDRLSSTSPVDIETIKESASPSASSSETDTKITSGSSSRAPKCTRCRNHGMVSDLRGHKHKCYWRDCTCTKCLISSDRQRATADRIALFRQQIRQVVTTDRRQRNSKRQRHEDDETFIDAHQQFSPPVQQSISPMKQPPSLTKMTPKTPIDAPYSMPTNPCWPPHGKSSTHYETNKHMDILRYIFPFYDLGSLDVISRDNNNDLLQTVLSISACLLENRQSNNKKSSFYYTTPHSIFEKNMPPGRCCSSPYCPVNSYLNLRQKSPEIMQHLPTPPLTANSHYERNSPFSAPPPHRQPTKKFRFSMDENELPYCGSCKKIGIKGDKFCPLCGILYSR